MRIFTEEIKQFIADNIKGMYIKDLTKKVNDTFGTSYTEEQIRTYTGRNKLTSGVPRSRNGRSLIFSEEVMQFIRENTYGTVSKELTDMVNQTFGTSYTPGQIKTYKSNNGLKSGIDARFKKGHIPPNKGKKGVCAPGCEKTWFKKGNVPVNKKPVGSERVDRDGYTLVKVAEPRTWKLKHRLVWEEHYGKVPRDHAIMFLDGDKTNFDISNLRLVTRNELKTINKNNLKFNNKELTETGLLIAKLMISANEHKKKGKGKEE